MREPVRFESVVGLLVGLGFDVFVEVSPHPVLVAGVEDVGAGGVVVGGSLRRGEGGLGRFLVSVGELFVRGVGVDWGAFFGGVGVGSVGGSGSGSGDGGLVELPTYGFVRERFWLVGGGGGVGDVGVYGLRGVGHGLLGAVVEVPGSGGVVVSG
ncbi:polyketide synthase, partial [Streptomyces sp. HSW2009]